MKRSQNSENFSPEFPSSSSSRTYIEIKEHVRYSETDQMGVAHNKNYFEWFKIGRTDKKVVFSYQLLSENKKQLMAKGYTIHIVTNAKSEVKKFPEDIINKLKS